MKVFQFVLVLSCCLFLGGCSKGLQGLTPCSGTLTQDGKPVEGVTVTFIPDSTDPQARGASAQTDANGNFNAKTLQWNGILPGQYKIILSKRITKVEPGQEAVDDNYKTVTYVEQMGKYANPEKSELTIEIKKTGNKNIKLEIKSE
ncbi:MAG: carboxypeptidase-like regulatory domain-containing protein [Planctomycetaceae bacterium]|jgi:hypothetical protein|nr:carboxypeptidase-like regulatory domain-containing protein [Planctomycetaceae bacterium]